MRRGINRYKWALLLGGVFSSLPLAGCSIAVLVTRTIVNEPLLVIDSILLKAKMDRLAKKAWREFVEENSHLTHSHSFREGFLDGFASFLDAGGNCVPPATPPRKYWRYNYLSPAGFQRTKDYMEGFQEGSLRAKGSNLRQSLLVPVLIGDDDLNPTGSSLKANYPSPLNNSIPQSRRSSQPLSDFQNEASEPVPTLPIPKPEVIPGNSNRSETNSQSRPTAISSLQGGMQ